MAVLGSMRAGWGRARTIYRHVAAVLATFGLASLVQRVFGLDWRGFLGALVGYWGHTIRPAVAWFFHVTVSTPLEWIGITFAVPLAVRDYLTVGFILATSFARVGVARRRHGRYYLIRNGVKIALIWPIMIVLWFPAFLPPAGGPSPAMRWLDPKEVAVVENHYLIWSTKEYLLVISPLFYLVVLLGINYLIL
jgi:hypothetical protein